MNYLYIILLGICLVTFVVTSIIMGSILINLDLKESMFYNFDTWKLFAKLMKERKSSAYEVLFWANISSFLAFIAVIIIAAWYYN